MTIKVSELAKKLGITSKEVVAKAVSMDIVAKAANSSLSEADAKDIENAVKNTNEGETETKVVRAGSKKVAQKNESEPKVQVKAAKVFTTTQGGKKTDDKKEKKTETGLGKRTPIGRPITKAEAEKRRKPAGVPITKAEKAEKEAQATKEKEAILLERKTDIKEEKIESKKNKINEPEIRRPKVVKKAEDVKKEEAVRRKNAAQKAAEIKKEKEMNKSKQEKINIETVPSNPEKVDTRKSRKKSKEKPNGKDENKYSDSRRADKKNKGPANHYGEKSLEKKVKKKFQKQKNIQEVEVETEVEEIPVGTKVINVPISIAGYCEQVGVSVSNVIMTLMKLGIVTNINANLDEDTALILSEELGVNIIIGNVEKEIIDEGLETFEDKEEDLVQRPPIITVMGHVDHGKTSLLDAIRATNVTEQESGGITQHIGASEVELNGQKIVFLDTPGHEAFTAMRARGANITDIAILVVAADDSVKPQTIESISHAKAAGVPIIVAINKMDKPGANPDLVKKDLADHGVLVEEWGGEVISVPVSAKTGEGIETILEMILLQSEILELKANPKRLGLGTVIEARLDKSKGPVTTLLITNGTVKSGESIVAGNTSGRIRLMTDFKGSTIKKAGPATAVEVLGLTEVPAAGDEFNVAKDDKQARDIAEKRKQRVREEVLARNASSTLEELFSQIQEGEVKDLNLIIKGDVMGSVGAIITSLEKLSNESVRVKIVHSGAGAINESDVTLASTSGAIVIGFNVRPSTGVQTMADRENVQIRTYRVIYNIIDDIENAMKGMLDPEFKEVILGQVEIREIFKVPGIGSIGGSYVTDGKVIRNGEVRIVRDGIVIHEGKISSLKRFKDDAKEVQQGYECGIGIENYNDIKEGDVIECFQMEEVERK